MRQPLLARRDDLGPFLNAHGLVGMGVEVGVQNALFSIVIIEKWRGEQLVLVDAWRGLDDHLDCSHVTPEQFENELARTRRRMEKHGDRVQIMQMLSVEAAATFPDGHLDFVYIDANHAYLSCKADLAAWWPKLLPGGWFGGHDFFNATPNPDKRPDMRDDPTEESLLYWGVKPAVEEFAAMHGKKINTTSRDFAKTWWFFK